MNLNSEAIKKNDVEIAINNVSVVFKDNQGNDVKALDNIDFDIHKGEFISLLGPSGCGKTTLLRTIADLLEPTSGNVRVSNMTPKEIRLMQKFGIVFQNPVLFEWRTVKKILSFRLKLWAIQRKTVRTEPMKCLKWSDLQSLQTIIRSSFPAVCSRESALQEPWYQT